MTTGDNGLATPGVIDADGDGTVDYIYAGDLKGNVWKFDVSGGTTASWKVDLSPSPRSANPLFKARDASNNPQPITAPITVTVNTDTGGCECRQALPLLWHRLLFPHGRPDQHGHPDLVWSDR